MELVKKETTRKAVFLLWDKEKQVVEGAGAVSVAVISGGNIEDKLFRSILASETTEA